MAEKRPRGRPTIYTEALAAEICRRISVGASLNKVCASEDMPSKETVMGWLREERHPGFVDQYARARLDQLEHWADELTDIADEDSDPQSARVRVDTRKWLLSKLLPKKYGDRVAVEHGGELTVKEKPASVDDAREVLREAGLS